MIQVDQVAGMPLMDIFTIRDYLTKHNMSVSDLLGQLEDPGSTINELRGRVLILEARLARVRKLVADDAR